MSCRRNPQVERMPTDRVDRDRFERERERNERAERERLRAAARRSVGENLEEGLKLIAVAQQFQAGFRQSSAAASQPLCHRREGT